MAEQMAVSAVGLVKKFGKVNAVDGLSFEVEPGECFGILGPNGAGKTTTVRMIYGYSPPTAGELKVFGLDVVRHMREVAAMIGVCQQDNNLDPDLTVRENLLVFARYFDIPRAEAERRTDKLLEFSSLASRADARFTELSGGMMRRLVMARALINDPSLLILDEPTTGLDPQSRHQLWDRLGELKARGLTVLLTTHYMDEAERLCDRLMIVDHGKVLVSGAPTRLIEDHVGVHVIEVKEPGPEIREYIEARGLSADDVGHRLMIYSDDGEEAFHEITATKCSGGCMLRPATLEDVFLRLTGRALRE